MIGVAALALLFLALGSPGTVPTTDVAAAVPAQQNQVAFARFHKAPEEFSLTPPVAAGRYDNVRGVYLTSNSVRNQKFADTVDELQKFDRPSVVFDVKGGTVFFETNSELAKEWGTARPIYDLPKILDEVHAKGIYAIGRFVAIKDEFLINLHPELSVRSPKTGNLIVNNWIDPANDKAIEYNMQVMCDLAASGIDEVNMDYIRYSTATPQALSVISPEEKSAAVLKFIKAARETIDRCGPKTKLGISTFAILGWNRTVNLPTLGQDVALFAPYVDIISPMAYPATFAEGAYYYPGKNPGPRSYYLVYRTLTGYAEWLGPEQAKKIRPWIQAYNYGVEDLKAEIKGVYDGGACGYQFWSAGNIYGKAYAAIKASEVPERCK
jgi:hypothetical protein